MTESKGSPVLVKQKGKNWAMRVHLYWARNGSSFDFVEEFTRCAVLETTEKLSNGISTKGHLVTML